MYPQTNNQYPGYDPNTAKLVESSVTHAMNEVSQFAGHPAFNQMVLQRGVDIGDIDTKLYWDVAAEYALAVVEQGEKEGRSPLELDALRLMAHAPLALFEINCDVAPNTIFPV